MFLKWGTWFMELNVCLFGVLDMKVFDSHYSTQLCLQNITSSRLCEWDVNHWQHLVCGGKQTGAAVSVMALARFIFWFTVSCQCTLDILLFDKLPIAPFICRGLMRHVLITLLLSSLWSMSDVRGAISGKKGGSLVTSSYLFYLITFQMTNKTLLPVGRRADWQGRHSWNGSATVAEI